LGVDIYISYSVYTLGVQFLKKEVNQVNSGENSDGKLSYDIATTLY